MIQARNLDSQEPEDWDKVLVLAAPNRMMTAEDEALLSQSSHIPSIKVASRSTS